MFPRNQSPYQTHIESSLFPNILKPNVLQPQIIGNINIRELRAPELYPEKNEQSLKGAAREIDLINFNEDLVAAPLTSTNIDKKKEINDYEIKMLEEFLSSAAISPKRHTSKSYTPEQEMQFQNFFDKYEASTSHNDLKNAGSKYNLAAKKLHTPNVIAALQSNNSEPSMVLIPKLHKLHIVENTEEIEDLIEEVLLDKNRKKQLHAYPTNRNDLLSKNVDTNTSRHCSVTNGYKKVCTTDIMNEIIEKNNVATSVLKEDDTFLSITHPNTGNMNHGNVNHHFQTQHYDRNSKSNDITIKICELVTKHNLKYLEAVKMDNNVFRKRSLLKSESDLLNLTPGPTLYEKSVVLPQMMQRLTERKKNVEEHRNMKPKLILDAGTSSHISVNATKMNKSVSDAIPSLLILQTQSRTHASSKGTTLNTNSFGIAEPAVIKTDLGSPAYTSVSNQNVCSNGPNRSNIQLIPIEKLKAVRRERLFQSSSLRYDSEDPQILMPPQVLMENCNRERYLSHATSRLFADEFNNGQ